MGLFDRILGNRNWTATDFWAWFQSPDGQQVVDGIGSSDDARRQKCAKELSSALKRVHTDVVWGMTPAIGKDTGEIEISAGGVRDLIPIVKEIVAAAPEMPRWRVIAFKQPSADFRLSLSPDDDGLLIAELKCRPGPQADGQYDLKVFLPFSNHASREDLARIGFIVIDHALGEYAVMTRIGHIEFLPNVAVPEDVIPLGEFSARLQAY